MGGGGTDTKTQTNAPSNPEVDPTLSKLLQGVRGTYDATPTTNSAMNSGWASQLAGANNADYARGVSGATSSFANAAAGNDAMANDAYYAGKSDDTLRDVNAMFTNSGRFGSGSHVGTATEALGRVNAENVAADRQWQTQSASMLPQLFAAGQAPGSVQTSVGQQQLQAPWANLQTASSILAGTAPAGGNTSTMTTPTAPWWQQVAGYVAGNAGKAAGMM